MHPFYSTSTPPDSFAARPIAMTRRDDRPEISGRTRLYAPHKIIDAETSGSASSDSAVRSMTSTCPGGSALPALSRNLPIPDGPASPRNRPRDAPISPRRKAAGDPECRREPSLVETLEPTPSGGSARLSGHGDVAVGLPHVPVRLPRANRRDVPPLGVLDLELLGEPRGDQLLHERLSLGTDRRKLVGLPAHDEVPTTHVRQARLGALQLLERVLEGHARGRLKRRGGPPPRGRAGRGAAARAGGPRAGSGGNPAPMEMSASTRAP